MLIRAKKLQALLCKKFFNTYSFSTLNPTHEVSSSPSGQSFSPSHTKSEGTQTPDLKKKLISINYNGTEKIKNHR